MTGKVIPFPTREGVALDLALGLLGAEEMELGFLVADLVEAMEEIPGPDGLARCVEIARALRAQGWGLR